jgi:hypothetical protein
LIGVLMFGHGEEHSVTHLAGEHCSNFEA